MPVFDTPVDYPSFAAYNAAHPEAPAPPPNADAWGSVDGILGVHEYEDDNLQPFLVCDGGASRGNVIVVSSGPTSGPVRLLAAEVTRAQFHSLVGLAERPRSEAALIRELKKAVE